MAKVKKEFITDKLEELYLLKWKSQGKTQKQFAEAIKEANPESGINETYVSKLLHGTYSPKQYLPTICQVLCVDISEFTPKTHDDRYQYAADYADGLEGSLEKMAEENFKIDLTFFQGLRNIIPDFDNVFPFFCPLENYGESDIKHKPYQRAVPAEAVETSKGQGLFQIMKDGRTIFLTKFDMKYIRAIQIQIRKYTKALFEAHQKTLEKAEADTNVYFWEKNKEINPNFDKDNTLWETYVLSDEELQNIDKSGIYTEKEEIRCKISKNAFPPDDQIND